MERNAEVTEWEDHCIVSHDYSSTHSLYNYIYTVWIRKLMLLCMYLHVVVSKCSV